MLTANAPVAAVARIEERKSHSVALFQWSSNRVAVHARSDGMHYTRELVSGDAPHRTLRTIAVALANRASLNRI